MLGRIRRTTRTDVGLALVFTGVAYLVWALVAGVSRELVQEMIDATPDSVTLTKWAKGIKIFFVDTGFVIDLVGLAWLAATLFLVIRSSRQKGSISWAWASAMGQTSIAAVGAVVVAFAVYGPLVSMHTTAHRDTMLEKVSGLSLPVILVVAILMWVTFLTWLLVERARFNRHGPTLRDGLKSNR